MAPTVVTGARATTVGLQQERRIVEMADEIFGYDDVAAGAPTLTILEKRSATQRAGNPVFKHLEDEPLPRWDTLAQTLSSATQTNGGAGGFLPTNVTYFRPGDLVLIPTSSQSGGEYLKVVTAAAGASFIVVRNQTGDLINGGTAANAAFCLIVTNLNEENTDTRQIKTTQEAVQTNYCGILKTPVGASGTEEASDLYGGPDRSYQRRKMGSQHAFEQEGAFLFSKKSEQTGTGGSKERTTGGLVSWITTNVTNANGTLTAATLETFCQSIFRFGSKSRVFLVSRRVASQLDLIAEGRIQTAPAADTYGVQMSRYLTTHGTLMITTHDMLENDYAGYGIAIDMANIKKRYTRNSEGTRDALLRTNINAPGVDGWIDEYLSEVGLHIILEKAHGVLKGVV